MPWDANTGTWDSSPLDNTGQTAGPGRPAATPPGYNNPYYDAQRQAQLGGQGSFQPTPTPTPVAPAYTPGTNYQDVFGSPQNSGNSTTMPVGSPDIYGGSSANNGGFYNFGGSALNANANPNPTLAQPTGQTLPYGNPAAKFGTITPYPAGNGAAPATAMAGAGAGATNPDAAYPKFDPAYLSQIQAALEAPNGPYAGRQPGDYAPPGAPDNIRNPQTPADWTARFYAFAQNPQWLANPSAPGAGLQAAAVPWQQFTKDVYSDANANRSFAELSGVVDDARLKVAQDQFGWQISPTTAASNDDAVAQASQMKQAHPEYSYQVYQRPDGSYGIAARELDQKAQEARNFYAPGSTNPNSPANIQARAVAPHPVSKSYSSGSGYKSGGSGYTTPTPAPAAPVGYTHIQPGPGLDTRMTGGSVDMGHPVEGQIVQYNGQMVQFRQGKWMPYSSNTGQVHASPV